MPKTTATKRNDTKKKWVNIDNVDLKLGAMVRLFKPTPTEEQQFAMDYKPPINPRPSKGGIAYRGRMLDQKLAAEAFFKPFRNDIDYEKEVRVVGFRVSENEDVYEQMQNYVTMLCQLKSGEFKTIDFLHVTAVKVALQKGNWQSESVLNYVKKLPTKMAEVLTDQTTSLLHVYNPWNEKSRQEVDLIFSNAWKAWRKVLFNYKKGNKYPSLAVQETLLPFTRHVKRTVNVWAKSFTKQCAHDPDYDNDETWKKGEKMTGAYSITDEISYAEDGISIDPEVSEDNSEDDSEEKEEVDEDIRALVGNTSKRVSNKPVNFTPNMGADSSSSYY